MADEKDSAQEALQQLLVKSGDRFRHYKGGEYEVIALAVKEDTLEPLVVYRSLAKGSTWVRTFENWNESVDVDGKQVRRFEKIS